MEKELLKKRRLMEEEEDFYDDDDEDTLEDMYLVFTCDKKQYALEIRYVTEIVALQTITEVPDLPVYIKGIINLRGKVFPVLDIRSRFNMPSEPYTERTCFVIASMDNSTIGLIVDAVTEVLKIPATEIEPPPKMGDALNSRYVQGIGKIGNGVKIILNLYNILHEEEVKKVDAKINETSGSVIDNSKTEAQIA